ncbi:MAG: tripartite tricarboxylate transporter substrate binding protein [Xanthobacteraceae bacterium]
MRKLLLALAFAAGLGSINSATAQVYPARPLHLVVGYPAGLTPDIIARLIARSLLERLGQQVIVDNRPGAGSNIGTEVVVRAPADGYTLLVVTVANAINATLYEGLNFDIVRDIAPIAGTFRSPLAMVVRPSFPAKSVPEFIAYAKANPGKINYASAGYGTVTNVAGELFKAMTGVELVHVPYRGSYVPDLLGGQVQATFAPIASVIEYIRAGKLRALAVTSATRSDALPDIPTVGEFVPVYEASAWEGIGVPKNTPEEIIEKLNKEINAVLADPKMEARLADIGAVPMPMTPAEFGKFIAAETEKWGKVIRAANIRPD